MKKCDMKKDMGKKKVEPMKKADKKDMPMKTPKKPAKTAKY